MRTQSRVWTFALGVTVGVAFALLIAPQFRDHSTAAPHIVRSDAPAALQHQPIAASDVMQGPNWSPLTGE
jgi:hypothetical protein